MTAAALASVTELGMSFGPWQQPARKIPSVKVETGAEFLVPSFIEMGDVVKLDTRTGEYVERVRQ